jgi:hypothetical protein
MENHELESKGAVACDDAASAGESWLKIAPARNPTVRRRAHFETLDDIGNLHIWG